MTLHYPSWYAVLLFPSFFIYLITMVGETNRLPFDLPEGEGELVGGFHTEYSSLKFALFYLAEYINMTTVAALATTLFLGGWRAPWPISVWAGANTGWWPLLWFLAKVLILLFCFVWLRGTLPRVRYDQLMRFGWKILIPASLAWILMIATIRVWRQHGGSTPVYIVGGAILGACWCWPGRVTWPRNGGASPREADRAAAGAEPGAAPPSFPVPPLDLPHYHGVGVTAGSGGGPADPDAVPRAGVKEVTGA